MDKTQQNKNPNNEFRHEYKLAINISDYYSIRQRLRAVTSLDQNALDNGRYHIRSLYFDNYDDKALREKIYGLPNREKFRLRIYNHDSRLVRLEKKSKENGLCRKFSSNITKEETELILTGNTEWMINSNEPLLTELYAKMTYQALRPRTIVDYIREAYIYPYGNVRITFDSDIRTSQYSTAIFEQKIPMLSVCEPGVLLLEIKYDGFIPDIIKDIIQTNVRRVEAFSKYAICRMYG